MGMYDTINGEQVKCFPWVSLYHGEITYHGGDLKYYGNGSEVPCRTAHYNYGKNFVILDYNRFPDSDYSDYDYYLHIIENRKVKKTLKDTIKGIKWDKNQTVVSYYGEMLNIHSDQDILDFIQFQRDYADKRENIRSHWNELFKEMSKTMCGIGTLNPESEERKMRLQKFDEIHKLMHEEEERIKPEMEALNETVKKWFVDTSDIDDCIRLGDFISAYGERSTDKELCLACIKKLLADDDTLYDRYVKWQGGDEYIQEFVSPRR